MTNTALGAMSLDEVELAIRNSIIFKDEGHKNFYLSHLAEGKKSDVYYRSLMYCLGICEDTRIHVNRVYDFKTECVKPECLNEDWMTSGSERIIKLAFNLYCNGVPSARYYDDPEDALKECKSYTVEDLFCCEYAMYFWEAIKLRYPEYCKGRK